MSLNTIFNLLLIVLGFGVLIFFHELGHFLAAKWAGIRAEGFAIGMGPVIVAYRKGIGIKFGSTSRATEARVVEYQKANNITLPANASITDQQARFYESMDALEIGETEYSLRWLPLGGFVKMLGQEDANPQAVSTLPGSYQTAPVWKRMIVVSAGVIMNIILAVVLFIWAFLVGVPFDAPIVGGVDPSLPAATAVAENAEELGITQPGLMMGDRVISVDDNETESFADLATAAAMAGPDASLKLDVERIIDGEPQRLEFNIQPEKSRGLLSLGIMPGRSTKLFESDEKADDDLANMLERLGLAQQGVRPGMKMLTANGNEMTSWQAFDQYVRVSGGKDVTTTWTAVDEDGNHLGSPIEATVPVEPRLQRVYFTANGSAPSVEDGSRVLDQAVALFGLAPMVEVSHFPPDSPNAGVLQPGDVLLRLADIEAPRAATVPLILADQKSNTVEADIIRNGERMAVELNIDSNGRIGIYMVPAMDLPRTAAIIESTTQPRQSADDISEVIPTPVAGLEIYAGSEILTVNGNDVESWADIRREFITATESSLATNSRASVMLEIALNTVDQPVRPVEIELSADDVQALHELGWQSRLDSAYFEAITVIVSADGNPIKAVAMGIDRTKMFVENVYLTIVRLFQKTVGVDQLRGPVGIVHVGTLIADRGLMYLLYFLALISVNLAVINFLPLPIVDGGLFLFLVYEKITGKPPSIAFQNIVTIAGLFLIVGLFLFVTYNDILRLFTGQ